MSYRGTQAWSAILALGFALANVAHASELNFKHIMDIGAEGTTPGHFKYVEDFAFGKNGELLVTDASHAYVQAFDARTGKFIARFGGKGDDEASLEKPEGIAVDAQGNIFVADCQRLCQKVRRVLQMADHLQWLWLEARRDHEVRIHGYPRREALCARRRQQSN